MDRLHKEIDETYHKT